MSLFNIFSKFSISKNIELFLQQNFPYLFLKVKSDIIQKEIIKFSEVTFLCSSRIFQNGNGIKYILLFIILFISSICYQGQERL
ncbi:Putative uncharacterized protein (plasmid) [Lactococcus lactis subsp. lactis]|nr:Putative uncharacterized protein [Lactococcus lactis subsp. lactis]